ncbi:hypothetical protein [Halobellus clavatus]|jgi:hypothetical protein|uniref:Uncharacterized protein n=1 Tax=Halobellus clavatus TaxID=660517 RepID=A0A1H3E682_9EURY|nr:hypothetical protein [Halobellus clavatus]SDX73399.1 hypothetical protein SAMN04487946_10233 [Halobellus clavatus]
MRTNGNTESCGRCSMSTVVEATDVDGDGPFDGERIEVDDDALRRISPGAWLGGLASRLDRAATSFIYGDR